MPLFFRYCVSYFENINYDACCSKSKSSIFLTYNFVAYPKLYNPEKLVASNHSPLQCNKSSFGFGANFTEYSEKRFRLEPARHQRTTQYQ